MPAKHYSVKRVAGLRVSERRAIATLACDEEPTIDAEGKIAKLKGEENRKVRTRFDHWIDGFVHDKYHHGWPNNPAYKECYVFKWDNRNGHNRLYGFLMNPTPKTNPRFRVCILVSHAIKTIWETDPSELNGANALRVNPAVVAAVKKEFPEKRANGEKRWVN